ncbi:MAG: hypothetical protein Kow0090_10600 [Myxococcota bacterium]
MKVLTLLLTTLSLLSLSCANRQNVGDGYDPSKESKDIITESGIQYDASYIYDGDFDGSGKDDWNENTERLCNGESVRPIIVDIDKTAVDGNFLATVKVNPTARDSLNSLDKEFGIIFLSANFVVDRMSSFFKRFGFPTEAPLITRPRNYWGENYESWCSADFSFGLCESAYKIDRIEYVRAQCQKPPPRMVGLGDKFSDYYAYMMAGLCPIIVVEGGVLKRNMDEFGRGCKLGKDGDWGWLNDGRKWGERCALIPDKYIMPWGKVEKATKDYLSGAVECGSWK